MGSKTHRPSNIFRIGQVAFKMLKLGPLNYQGYR
jgi:hypothetical protein